MWGLFQGKSLIGVSTPLPHFPFIPPTDEFLFPESRSLLLVIVKGQVILLFPINCPLLRVDRHPYIEYVFLTAFLRLMGKSRRFLRHSNNVFTL